MRVPLRLLERWLCLATLYLHLSRDSLGVAVFSKKHTFNSGMFQPHNVAAMADALSSRFMSSTLLMVAAPLLPGMLLLCSPHW